MPVDKQTCEVNSSPMKPQTTPRTCAIATALYLAARGRGKEPLYRQASDQALRRAEKRLHHYASRQGLPWPRALGTSPWALARLLEQVNGHPYRVARWNRHTQDALRRTLAAGMDCAAYVGGVGHVSSAKTPLLHYLHSLTGALSALIPRHVVGLLAPADNHTGEVIVAEPAQGRHYPLNWEEFLRQAQGRQRRATWGNWQRVIAVVLPVDS